MTPPCGSCTPRPAARGIGWPTELLLAAAAAVVGYASHGLGAAAGGPAIASAAGFAVAAIAVLPVLTGRDVLRVAVGCLLLIDAGLLVRAALGGTPGPLEQLLSASPAGRRRGLRGRARPSGAAGSARRLRLCARRPRAPAPDAGRPPIDEREPVARRSPTPPMSLLPFILVTAVGAVLALLTRGTAAGFGRDRPRRPPRGRGRRGDDPARRAAGDRWTPVSPRPPSCSSSSCSGAVSGLVLAIIGWAVGTRRDASGGDPGPAGHVRAGPGHPGRTAGRPGRDRGRASSGRCWRSRRRPAASAPRSACAACGRPPSPARWPSRPPPGSAGTCPTWRPSPSSSASPTSPWPSPSRSASAPSRSTPGRRV